MNPERINEINTGEFDDSPYADTTKGNLAYKANLKSQRAQIAKEDQEATNQQGREILESLNKKTYAHEGHKKFRAFYQSLEYDEQTEFMHKSPAEKEEIFLKWLEDRSK